MGGYIDSAGVTGLAPESATLYAVAHNVDPKDQIVFSYCHPDMASWIHPTEDNYTHGDGTAHQPVYCVLHNILQPDQQLIWQCEIRSDNSYIVWTTGPKTFRTPSLQRPTNRHFMPGNRFWEYKSSFGPRPIFPNATALWQACCEYFVWVDEHPLWEDHVIAYKGEASHEPLARMRAMTHGGLQEFLGITATIWASWRKSDRFSEVCARVDGIIKTHKFQGAAASLLNPNLIARDLGLADRTEHTGKDGGPIEQRNAIELDAERFTRTIMELGSSRSEAQQSTEPSQA